MKISRENNAQVKQKKKDNYAEKRWKGAINAKRNHIDLMFNEKNISLY